MCSELGAGPGADRLDPLAAVAEHDRALARPLDIDDLLDAHAAVRPLFPALGLDRRGIGQFVMQLQEHLLARHLGGEPALGSVGQLVFREQPRPGRHGAGEMPL